MIHSRSIVRNLKSITFNLVLVSLIMYFLFHMLNGARGAVSLIKLTKSSYEIERELANIKEDNSFLQNKIRLLQNDNLDLDLLEELAYNILGFAKAENMIMLLPR